MAKKLKTYYDKNYLEAFAKLLDEASSDFDSESFFQLTLDDIDVFEFMARQNLIAHAIHESLAIGYPECLEVFYSILGPELPNNKDNYNKGYWLWPIGKFVEIYGLDDYAASIAFSKELTKRFTSEYCMRPLLAAYPEESLQTLLEWSQDGNMRVRRLASECIRIRLPWSKKLTVALDYFEAYEEILSNLKHDSDKFVQKSVANNLNDLYKESPIHFEKIVKKWDNEKKSEATDWILKHGSRSIK
ncbi:DNA alkylation repair protein [Fundicoccus sp. Sow4_H7]|uniref:DNA alkylation repair protein n=1 Tax=Fundicoccus sp. Sow4_H7 TaxID=3438784 RepID=UPI003F926BC6